MSNRSCSVSQFGQRLADLQHLGAVVFRIGYDGEKVNINEVLNAMDADSKGRVTLNGKYIKLICDYRAQAPRGYLGQVVFDLED